MNQSHQTQIEKYGGVEGYKAEMRRRRSLVKKFAFKDNPELAKEAVKKRWAENEDKQAAGSEDQSKA